MTLPPLTAPCWHRLATGGLEKIKTQNLGTRLLIKRLQRAEASVNENIHEIYAYYKKWERGLSDEIAQFA